MVKAELRGILTGFAAVAAGVLVAVSLDVGVPGQALLQSIRFHLAIGMLALPLLLLLGGARWRALLFLLLIIASVTQGGLVVLGQHNTRTILADARPLTEFSLLSFNVLSENARGDDAADFIVETAPDVAVIMEAPGVEPYFDRLATVLPYRAGCDVSATCDLALFSRTPLIDAQVHPLGDLHRLRFITARTVINGQMVTLAAVHLSKPYFDENAWVELYQVRRALRDIEGPVIVSGDFNAAAWSRSVADFAEQANLIPPPRYPATWPVRLGEFGVPIDNMFTRAPALI